MSIGTGIAILGVWLFPSACAFAPSVTNSGLQAVTLIAGLTTVFLVFAVP